MSDIDWSKAPEGYDLAYTTGPSWDGGNRHKDEIRFCRINSLGNPQSVCGAILDVGDSSWVFVGSRPSTAWSGEGKDFAESELKRLADKYLSYSPDTGVLIWKDNQQKRFIGREAGFVTHHGYRRINLGKTQIHAHQLIWLMVNGCLPDCEIDHLNGSRDDNRIENLRLATTQQNQQNAGVRVDNVLGIKGVRLRPSGRYQARVSLTDGSRLTKTFRTHTEAVCWLAKQREDSHGDFANTPEQVAADEREEACEEMLEIAKSRRADPDVYEAIATLYDAGFRKP